jgi:hypothetical protein
MIGVIVTDKFGNIQKRIYAGDEIKSNDLINKDIAANPLSTFTIHSDTDKDWQTAFLDVQETKLISQDQTNWQTAKAAGGSVALSFIAKKLGLE